MIANTEWLPTAREALEPALHIALALEHASMGMLLLKDGRGAWESLAASGLTDAQAAAVCAQLRETALFEDGNDGHLFLSDTALAMGGAERLRGVAASIGFRAADIVALHTRDDGVMGAVVVLFRGPRQQNARGARLAQELCSVVALGLRNARLCAEADQRRAAAEESARARLRFVAKISHELRAPLQSITGYVELLRLGLPDRPTARQSEMLDRVCASERVLLGVVDDLSGLARSETEQLSYRVRDVQADVLVNEAMTVIAPLARKLQVTVSSSPGPGDVHVAADERKSIQVLVNLLTNAIKFSRPHGLVRIRCRSELDDVHFDVVDEGPGIPPDKLGTVFEPYVQLETAAHPGATLGLGLGLAISRELAAGMGGTVSVVSAPNEGSTFTLTLRSTGARRRTPSAARRIRRPAPRQVPLADD